MSFKSSRFSGTITAPIIMMSQALPVAAQAKDITVKITNITNGLYFTPLLVTAHSKNIHFYKLGELASESLQAMAEGGDISGLSADARDNYADVVENPAGGLLAPGHVTTAQLSDIKHKNKYLSVMAMLLPTNDGFFAADALKIPKKSGTYTFYLNAYDAGTEANNEVINGGGAPGTPGIPAAPGADGGIGASGVTREEANQTVHIHRGIIGDDYAEGGISDLDPVVHRWMNPVVKMEVTVSCEKFHYYEKNECD